MTSSIKVNTNELYASADKMRVIAEDGATRAVVMLGETSLTQSIGETASVISAIPEVSTTLTESFAELANRTAFILEHAADYFDDVDASLASGF